MAFAQLGRRLLFRKKLIQKQWINDLVLYLPNWWALPSIFCFLSCSSPLPAAPADDSATSITISPTDIEVTTVDTVQFTAVLANEFGVVVDGDLSWSATGGTIDNQGVFHADGIAAIHKVLVEGPGDLVDTASVYASPKPLSQLNIGAAVQLETFLDKETLLFDWDRWEITKSLLAEGNVDWVRLVFDWRWIEPDRGAYTWNGRSYPYDRVVTDLHDIGIQILGLFLHTPTWATTDGGGVRPPTSDNLGHFSEFLQATVNRYRDHVGHWEIWNEPNISEFWSPEPNLEAYMELLAVGYAAIKSADQTAFVVSAGLAHSPDVLDWLQGMYSATFALSDYSDGVGFHAYTWHNSGPDSENRIGSFRLIESVYDVMQQNGDGEKGVWLTELGWKAEQVGEALQAEYLKESLDIAGRVEFVDAYFWFEFVDRAASYGMIRDDLSKRPSFDVFMRR